MDNEIMRYVTLNRSLDTHLLQLEELNSSPVWQIPFHDLGTGAIPLSLKLFDSGHTPDSHMPSRTFGQHKQVIKFRINDKPCLVCLIQNLYIELIAYKITKDITLFCICTKPFKVWIANHENSIFLHIQHHICLEKSLWNKCNF